jgi:hypothetical protein
VAVSSEQDKVNERFLLTTDLSAQIDAGEIRHFPISDDNGGVVLYKKPNRFSAVSCPTKVVVALYKPAQ